MLKNVLKSDFDRAKCISDVFLKKKTFNFRLFLTFVAEKVIIINITKRPADAERGISMKAVITVTGKDCVGIIAGVAGECSKWGVNILDISQSVLQEYFAMIMLADIDGIKGDFGDFVDAMSRLGKDSGLQISTMHEDIFNTMHHI